MKKVHEISWTFLRCLAMQLEDNIYYKKDSQKFLELEVIVRRNPKNYFHELKARKHEELVKWINDVVPALNISFFKISTKVYWILNSIVEFPRCKQCGKAFDDRNVGIRHGYPDFCSCKCSNSNADTIAKQENSKLLHYGDAHYVNPLKAKTTRHLRYNGKYESQETKTRREMTCIKHFGKSCIFSCQSFKDLMRKKNLEVHGVEFSSQRSEVAQKIVAKKLQKYGNKIGSYAKLKKMFTPEIREKSKATCLQRYGTENGGASLQAQLKAKRRYIYNGIGFDSAPELALFIWLVDNQIQFEYHSSFCFEYQFEGQTCRYYPDFHLKSCNLWIELKGDHFFKPDGTMHCPFKKRSQSIEQHWRLCQKYEAKHQCMQRNKVMILRNADYQFALDYVNEKYGKDYLKKFRKSEKSES